jgi:calcium permeable stress-gated cation channel
MSHQTGSTSGAAILAAFVPTFTTAVIYIGIFATIRNSYRKIYAPRTFLGTVPKKDRTPESDAEGHSWFQEYRKLPDHFVLQHNSLDAYLYLRFLKFIIGICFIGTCITWPILLPANITGGGTASQLDRLSFSNVAKKNHLWAHLVVASRENVCASLEHGKRICLMQNDQHVYQHGLYCS